MAMASTAFLSFHSVESQRFHHRNISQNPHQVPIFVHKRMCHLIYTLRCTNLSSIIPQSNSESSSSSSYPSASLSSSTLRNSLQTGRFLTNDELEKLQFLEDYRYFQELKSGFLYIRLMQQVEMDMAVGLLAESFAESMSLPSGYVRLLEFLVKQYLIERRGLMPHSATLLGFYKEDEEEDLQLAGTVEVSFNKRGANASPPSPAPPKNSPYICNMAVKEPLRRYLSNYCLLLLSYFRIEVLALLSIRTSSVYFEQGLIKNFYQYVKYVRFRLSILSFGWEIACKLIWMK